MARTIRSFLQSLEKRQTLIKSLATLKTENSRLRELVASKSQLLQQMAVQLEAVATAKKSLQDLITSLFAKMERITETKQLLHAALQRQRENAAATLQTLHALMETLRSGKEEEEKGKAAERE